MLAVACQPSPVSPDRVEEDEQTSANSCPVGSPPSEQCQAGTGSGTGGLGGTGSPSLTTPGTSPLTTPADTTTDTTPEATGCLPMQTTTYTAGGLTLNMTVVSETATECALKLVFIATVTKREKTYSDPILNRGGPTGRMRETTCISGTDKEDCYYKILTLFPENGVGDVFPESMKSRDSAEWWTYVPQARHKKSYTIKYLNIDKGNRIKMDYVIGLNDSFDLDISTDEGVSFVDGNGKKPRIEKR